MTRINGETKARVARPDRLAAGYRISVVVLHHQHHYLIIVINIAIMILVVVINIVMTNDTRVSVKELLAYQ